MTPITEQTKVTITVQAIFTPNGETMYQLNPPDCVPSCFVPDGEMVADILRNGLEICEPLKSDV